MEKKLFIKKIFEDVHFLIDNYLNNGQFVSYEKWGELDGFFYEKFPFLSIAFLIKENFSVNDYDEFIKRYKNSISLEVKTMKELFLTDMDEEIKQLKSDNKDLTKQCENLQVTINELKKLYSESEQHVNVATKEIETLKKRNTFLETGKPVINVLTRDQIVAVWSNYYTLPYINDNAIFDKTNFDIDGFIKDLSTKFSIEITSDELLSNNSLTKVIDLLESKQSCYKDDFNNLLKQYPQKKEIIKEITINNVTQIILSCCPRMSGATRKYVFCIDTLEKAQLDVKKLNSILYYSFGLKHSSETLIRSAKNIDDLKFKILFWQNMKKSPNTAISGAGTIAAFAIASSMEKLKLSGFFYPRKK